MSTINELYLTDLDAHLKPHPFRGHYRTALIIVSALLLTAAVVYLIWGRESLWGGILGFTVVVAISLPLRHMLMYRKRRPVGENGVPVRAFLVQANSMMFRKNFGELPCQVLFSFEDGVNGNVDYLQSLAERMYSLKRTKPEDSSLRAVAAMVTNEQAAMHRRRPLPASFTGGPVVYVGDLWIESKYLREQRLTEEDRLLPCLATPGEKGGLELIPWWVVDQYEKQQIASASAP